MLFVHGRSIDPRDLGLQARCNGYASGEDNPQAGNVASECRYEYFGFQAPRAGVNLLGTGARADPCLSKCGCSHSVRHRRAWNRSGGPATYKRVGYAKRHRIIADGTNSDFRRSSNHGQPGDLIAIDCTACMTGSWPEKKSCDFKTTRTPGMTLDRLDGSTW